MIYFNEAILHGNSDHNKSDISFNLENSGRTQFSDLDKTHEKYSASLLLKNDCQFLNTSSLNVIFTSIFNLKTFQIIKNHFKSIFKIVYPEDFFTDIYNKKFHSIIGLVKDTKEVLCFSHIEIDKKNKKAKILTLGVVKEYQNKGIGTRLMNKVLEELTIMGIADVSLIVQELNVAAIKLYTKFDFNIEKKMENYYSIGGNEENQALLMRRNLVIKKVWIYEVVKKVSNCFK